MKSEGKRCSCAEGHELLGNQCTEQEIEAKYWPHETFGAFDVYQVPPLHNTFWFGHFHCMFIFLQNISDVFVSRMFVLLFSFSMG